MRKTITAVWNLLANRQTWSAILTLTLLPAATAAQSALKGRVVIESSRQGLQGANLLVHADSQLIATAVTDAQGFFSVRVPPGSYRVTAQLIGYASAVQQVTLGAADVTVPAFVLKAESIELKPIEITGDRASQPNARPRTGSVVWGGRLAKLEQSGARMVTALRELNGVKAREWNDRDGRARVCVESRRPRSGFIDSNACPWVEIVVDGIPVGDGEIFFKTLNVHDYESIEFVGDNEANKYGSRASQFGALVLWTRGRGPHISAERNRN